MTYLSSFALLIVSAIIAAIVALFVTRYPTITITVCAPESTVKTLTFLSKNDALSYLRHISRMTTAITQTHAHTACTYNTIEINHVDCVISGYDARALFGAL